MYVLKNSLSFSNLSENAFLGMNLMYYKTPKDNQAPSILPEGENSSDVPLNTDVKPVVPLEEDTSAQALITVSHTKVTKLAAGEDYHGELTSGFYRFHLFKIVNPNK